MITKAMYIAQRTAAIEALDVEIDRLTQFADRAGDDIALVYYEAVEALRAQRNQAVRRLDELRAVNDRRWRRDPATQGLEQAWSGVRHTILNLVSERPINCSIV